MSQQQPPGGFGPRAPWEPPAATPQAWGQPQAQPPFSPPAGGFQPPPGYGSPAPGLSPMGPDGFGSRTEPMALASLILGILSIPMDFCCYLGFPLGIVGIVLGIMAIAKINKEPARWSGKGLAIGGIAASVVGFLIYIGYIVVILGLSLASVAVGP